MLDPISTPTVPTVKIGHHADTNIEDGNTLTREQLNNILINHSRSTSSADLELFKTKPNWNNRCFQLKVRIGTLGKLIHCTIRLLRNFRRLVHVDCIAKEVLLTILDHLATIWKEEMNIWIVPKKVKFSIAALECTKKLTKTSSEPSQLHKDEIKNTN